MSNTPNEINVNEFFDRFLSLLDVEKLSEIKLTNLLTSNVSIKTLERNGLSVCNLSVKNLNLGLGGKSLLELDRSIAFNANDLMPPHSMRPGDIAAVVDQNKREGKRKSNNDATIAEGVIYKSTEKSITIAIESNKNGGDDLDLPERLAIIKLANLSTFERMHKNLEKFKSLLFSQNEEFSPQSLTTLLKVVLGFEKPKFEKKDDEFGIIDQSLNESQVKAVKLALEADTIALIHGPPGTGKSYTLIEIIRQFVNQGKRILVCGASNLAVDNILERLIPFKLPLTRLGHPARVLKNVHTSTLEFQTAHSSSGAIVKDVKQDIEQQLAQLKTGKIKGKQRKEAWGNIKELRKEYRKREQGVIKGVVSQSQIVLATCHGAGGKQLLSQPDFDICIIDESTQALEPSCWIPILKSKKLILAGDPLQLPPTIISRNENLPKLEKEKEKEKGCLLTPPKTLERTLFERLVKMYGNRIKCLLNTQYRMNELIQNFPSSTLYNDELKAFEGVKSRSLLDLPNISSFEGDKDEELLSAPLTFIDTDGCDFFERVDNADGSNVDDEGSKYNENECEVVVKRVNELIENGVLSSQIAIITPYQAQVSHLSALLHEKYPELEIGSVDGVQGREQEVVIMSLVRSNDKGEVGFLKEERRLNVAMTRAKRQLCVIGNSATIKRGSTFLKKWMDYLEDKADIIFPEQ